MEAGHLEIPRGRGVKILEAKCEAKIKTGISWGEGDAKQKPSVRGGWNMGGRYHQKYMNFKRFRQKILDGSSVHCKITQTIKKWHSQSTNCSYFFTGIE